MEKNTRRPRSNDYRYDDERLRFVIRASGLHPGLFARRIGLEDSEELYAVLCGKTPLTDELVARIHACFPQVNANWLRHGPARLRGGI